jgi:hypothetical protein
MSNNEMNYLETKTEEKTKQSKNRAREDRTQQKQSKT